MALDPIGSVGAALPAAVRPVAAGAAAVFGEALAKASGQLQLSRHAQQRVDRRDLDLDAGRMARLNTAVSRAAEKGARNSVVMLDDLAVVVDVRQRTVVTAMQREGGNGRVFTNIDSVVIA
jgi:flagellar operon protein